MTYGFTDFVESACPLCGCGELMWLHGKWHMVCGCDHDAKPTLVAPEDEWFEVEDREKLAPIRELVDLWGYKYQDIGELKLPCLKDPGRRAKRQRKDKIRDKSFWGNRKR